MIAKDLMGHVGFRTYEYSNKHPVGRLNGMVFSVTEFDKLSYVTSPFWSRKTKNWGIEPISQTELEKSRRGSSLLSGEYMRPSPTFFCSPQKSKWFPPFCRMDFSVCFLNACDSSLAWDGNLVPKLYCVQLCHIIWLTYSVSNRIFNIRLLSLG